MWHVGLQYAQVLLIVLPQESFRLSLSFSHPINRFCPNLQMTEQIGFTLPPLAWAALVDVPRQTNITKRKYLLISNTIASTEHQYILVLTFQKVCIYTDLKKKPKIFFRKE